MCNIIMLASPPTPAHDDGGWSAARARAQRLRTCRRQPPRSSRLNRHVPAAPPSRGRSDSPADVANPSPGKCTCQKVRKGIVAILSPSQGTFDHMLGQCMQRGIISGPRADTLLRLRVSHRLTSDCRPPWAVGGSDAAKRGTFLLYRLDSKLGRSRGCIGRVLESAGAAPTAAGRSRRPKGPPCTSPVQGRG